MNIKIALLLLFTAVYFYFSGKYILCDIKETCQTENVDSKTEGDNPVTFTYGGYDAFSNDNFDQFKLDLLSELGESNKLKITGLYGPAEENTSGMENLGFARAKAFKDLLPELDESRFYISTEEVAMDDSKSRIEGVEWKVMFNSEHVVEIDQGARIYFPSNSEEGIIDEDVDQYLSAIVAEHMNTTSNFDVNGHSDNQGDDSDNFSQGLKRAKSIKNILVEKGLDASRIITNSRGESEPIADNSTEEGRAKNRRVEILIN